MNPYLDAALTANAVGLSVYPPKEDGSKEPAGPWKEYQSKRADEAQIREWYKNGRTGLGIIAGKVSGSMAGNALEMLETDDPPLTDLFIEAAHAIGLGDVMERIRDGFEEETPGGGRHWAYYCSEIEGNTKLAERPKRPEELKIDSNPTKTLIETRSEGGWFISHPSGGRVHPTGGAYRLLRGGFASIATITPQERHDLFALARTFGQMPVKEPYQPKTPAGDAAGERPGDIFNQRATWPEVLEPQGWAFVFERNGIAYWRRPGKARGVSATTNAKGSDSLIVFSTSTEFNSHPSSYSKFDAYALLNHGGDFTTAARDLYRLGYHTPNPDIVMDADERTEEATPATEQPEKPEITVGGRYLPNVAGDTLAALDVANQTTPTLFVRDGKIAHIQRDEHQRPTISQTSKDDLLVHAARAARWKRLDARSHKMHKVSPPDEVLRYIMARGSWPFPSLLGITETPALRPDGSILATPGYDEATRLFYAPAASLRVPEIPVSPTAQDVRAAVDTLLDLILDFPLDSIASTANALALMLTPIMQPAIAGPAPLALIDKNVPGAGATLLAEMIGILTLGRAPGLTSAPRDDEEMEKRITALLREGESYVCIDNVDRPLDYSSLALVLTASEWAGRILGRSDTARFPNRATWMATGVNLAVRSDVARRSYLIRLIAPEAQPWRLEGDNSRYRHPNLLGYVHQERGALVAATLTLARAWFAAGCPPAQTPRLGKFENWCDTIGGILHHARIGGFLDNLDQLYEQVDEDGPEWEMFLRAWRAQCGDTPASTTEITKLLRSAGGGETPADRLREALPAELADVFGNPHKDFSRSLGRALAKKTDRRFGTDGIRIQRAGPKNRPTWRVILNS